MKIIVFGGSGFLGSHVADVLTEANHQVVIFDIAPSPYLRPEQEMIVGDILDSDTVGNAMSGCDVVYNFAGIADLDDATTKPLETIHLNVLGTCQLLQAAVETGCQRFIYASSLYVYSDRGGFYRCSKQAAELYVEEYQRKHGLEFSILRFGSLYGPRSDKRNAIYRYLRQALTNRRIEVKGTGDEMREYVHARDAAIMSRDILSPIFANKHVIISGQQMIRYSDLLQIINEIMNHSVDIRFHHTSSQDHYSLTPYSYTPKVGLKVTLNGYTDLGQGLLQCLAEIDSRVNTLEHATVAPQQT